MQNLLEYIVNCTVFQSKYSTDPFTKRHKLVHNGKFPKFEALYCNQNTVKSIKIQLNLSYKVRSSKSQNFTEIEKL